MAILSFVFMLAVQNFAQKTEDRTAEQIVDKETQVAVVKTTPASKKDATDSSAAKTSKPEKDIDAAEVKAEAEKAASYDDTMMGVMGQGTDKVKLGGHVGFVVPIVAHGNGVTTNLADRFVFGFPVGLTVKTKHNIAIDFEFIPTFNTGNDFVLTIHPGIIYGFAKNYAVGVRAAYDAGADSYGFTPLVSRGFKINEKVGCFIEADFPVRWNKRPVGNDRFTSGAFAAHFGFSF